MSAINIIRDDDQLAGFIDAVSQTGRVAVDTEFLRERTYAPELCLIQITADQAANGGAEARPGKNAVTACIDPLAMDDLAPLGALLANPEVEKIFHSCRQDLEALDTRIDIRAANLYDTQLAAAFCGYGGQVSYAALVESLCAVHLPKSHTRADWSRRPLPRAHLEYAMDDVKYLHPLRRELDGLLAQKGRIEWHRDECARAADPANYRFDAGNGWLRLKGAERLDAAGRVCAKNLAVWREQRARDRNLPRNWILPTPALLQLCRLRPATPEQLAQIEELSRGTVKHAGRQLIAIIAQSRNGAASETARSPALTSGQRGRVKQIMKLLGQRAEQAEISRSLFANRQEVESFVRGNTDLPLFTGWRAQLAGEEILARYS